MNLRYLILTLLIAALLAGAAYGQRHRYNFAQTYIGLQADYLHGAENTPDFGAARILIGGSHFWYHADFYISFPLSTFALSESAWNYSEGVTTGGRYLPFGPGKRIPLPFVGLNWMTPSLRIGEGPELQRSRLGLEAGLSLVVRKRYTLEARVQYQRNATLTYPTSRESTARITPPEWTFGLTFKKYFDITAGNASPEAKAWVAATEKTFEERGALSAWSLAAGLTANVVLGGYRFEGASFLPPRPSISLAPDLAIGYYFHRADLGVRLAYRPISIGQEAYGYQWQLREHRLAAEGFKFLFDYHGFLPFVGVLLGALHQNYSAHDGDLLLDGLSGWSPAAGLVFGWDIRPTKVDWLILRTNLRLNAAAGLENADLNLRSTQLEVNFIQVVVYPQRLSNLKYVQP